MSHDKEPIAVDVPAKDPKKKDSKQKKGSKKEDEQELSAAMQKVKDDIDMLVERLSDEDPQIVSISIEAMSNMLRGTTESMASVPPPLKFLRGHLSHLEEIYTIMTSHPNNQKTLADLLSVVSSTMPTGERKALQYRLSGTGKDLTSWGPEFLRNISSEVVAEFEDRNEALLKKAAEVESAAEQPMLEVEDLMKIVFEIVPFYMARHNEVDAVDLLVEIQRIDSLPEYVDRSSSKKICQYLTALASFAASGEDFSKLLSVAYTLFLREGDCCQAARVALKLRDSKRIKEAFDACSDDTMRSQLAYLLASQRCEIEGIEESSDAKIAEIISCEWMHEMYALLAKELDVLEPKSPEDVYKSHLEGPTLALDSARENLASTFVNAFVNAGFGTDNLMSKDDNNWLYKNKDVGMLVASASLGVINLWDWEKGLAKIDKYQWSSEPNVKAGALLGFGLVASGIKTDVDPAIGLLSEHLDGTNTTERITAILGLGIAYVGSQKEVLLELLVPLIIDTSSVIDVSAFAALSLGLAFLGSGNQNAAEAIVQTLLERQFIAGALDSTLSFLFGQGLALLFLGLRSESEATIEALEAVSQHRLGAYTSTCVIAYAHAGTGDVVKIQQFLKACVDKVESGESKEEEDRSLAGAQQGAAVLAMPLIAMGEDVGNEMILRMTDHLLQYGNVFVKRAIPLSLALTSLSSPRPAVVDVLSRLTHESDSDVSLHAILALGLVGAGTNNSRIAELFRQLAVFFDKSAIPLFVVRIAQGLLYMGKGLLTLSPLHSSRFLINYSALGCLLVILQTSLFLRETILGHFPFLLYLLIPAMRPRMLITLDEKLNPLPVIVRVGQAVDTTGQAGNPRTITGFQTHTTPVLLSEGDRAELGTTEYMPVSSLPLEGIVILRRATEKELMMTDQ